MRKVQLLLLCLLVSVAAFAAEKVIKLPKPNMNRSGSVMNALSERHSTREYAAKALTSADLSDLLCQWCKSPGGWETYGTVGDEQAGCRCLRRVAAGYLFV